MRVEIELCILSSSGLWGNCLYNINENACNPAYLGQKRGFRMGR
jgi:hypothetical protein